MNDKGSMKTVVPSSKETWCLRKLPIALASSHSKFIRCGGVYPTASISPSPPIPAFGEEGSSQGQVYSRAYDFSIPAPSRHPPPDSLPAKRGEERGRPPRIDGDRRVVVVRRSGEERPVGSVVEAAVDPASALTGFSSPLCTLRHVTPPSSLRQR